MAVDLAFEADRKAQERAEEQPGGQVELQREVDHR